MDDEERRKNIPEEFDGNLDCSSLALCCSFNHCGSLLAVGCNDGRIVIWDFLNRFVAKHIPAHAGHPVSSISWSRKGHKLVSASLDNSIAIWNVLTAECKVRWIFKAPLTKVQFNPRNENLVIVCPFRHSPVLLKINYGADEKVEYRSLPTDKETDAECNMTASFDRRGEYIYTGDARGQIAIFKCPTGQSMSNENTFELVSSFRIQPIGANPASIGEIEFALKCKKYFLVNCSDRTIRLYNCDSALKAGIDGCCEEIRRFQDMISKTVWKRCCFSGDKDATFVCGGSARQNALYIWGTEDGTVKKFLQGSQREMLLDIQWHPTKPTVASVSSGLIFIWARAEVENWSAYAPQFKELEENQEYSESESEFDIEDEDKAKVRETSTKTNICKRNSSSHSIYEDSRDSRICQHEEDELVDVVNVKYDEGDYKSSDEEGYDPDALEYIPVSLEDYEMVEAGPQP